MLQTGCGNPHWLYYIVVCAKSQLLLRLGLSLKFGDKSMMSFAVIFSAAVCSLILLQLASGSYLDVPRVHFTGEFRADVNTRNNEKCSFKPDYNDPDLNKDWNFNGTNEINFINTDITGVDYSGASGLSEDEDPVLSAFIVTNINRPYAKLTDLDTDAQDKSTIYGMKIGISWGLDDNGQHDLAFMGTWTRSVIAQDMWVRMKCFTEGGQDSHPFGSQGTTILTDIEWGNLNGSTALQQLKDESEMGSGMLSIRVSYYYYTRNYGPLVPYRFVLGNVIGSIGVYNVGETLNFGGERLLTSDNGATPDLTFEEGDSCHGIDASAETWVSNSPFKLTNNNGNKEVVIDFSNGLPINTDSTQRDIGELYIGYRDSTSACVQIIDPDLPIPYMEKEWSHSGEIAVYSLEDDEYNALLSNKLVVVQKVQNTNGESICGSLPSTGDTESAIVILEEREYFIRPLDYYVDRLEYSATDPDTSTRTLLVTRFGSPASVQVKIIQSNVGALPVGGVAPDSFTRSSNNAGLVSFVFSVAQSIPYPRQYSDLQCPKGQETFTLPIDGQVYSFGYCVIESGETECEVDPSKVTSLAFLAFSTISYTRPYTWVKDVQPIFSQYADLSNVMKSIVDLSNYTAVTQIWNLEMIKHSMSLDIEDPNFMPTNRDLSPTKTVMILEWLDNPIYSTTDDPPETQATCQHPEVNLDGPAPAPVFFTPPRCLSSAIPVNQDPEDLDPYFDRIFRPTKQLRNLKRIRPLFGFNKRLREKSDAQCTLDDLKSQLQLAMQVEFYTIPTYLTALYSIADGCNQQIYDTIRSVAMQEMMHLAQAANLLISIGGDPVIDSASFAPVYPHLGLPGGVLPALYVTLEKLSLRHVYQVFMGIEVPAETYVGDDEGRYAENTIGEFYEEVANCIKSLPDTIFDPLSVNDQVGWPWDGSSYIGHLLKIDSRLKALAAIEQITVQGEGADPFNPNATLSGEYAHFYRYEEVVCQKSLVYSEEDNSYSYTGNPIPFDPQGVWPMRDNPSLFSMKPNTNCYTEAVAFNRVYHSFLRKLQETFTPCRGGADCIDDHDPQKLLMDSVEIMEALQVHAKKLMWIDYDPDNPGDMRTCGPAWDYIDTTCKAD